MPRSLSNLVLGSSTVKVFTSNVQAISGFVLSLRSSNGNIRGVVANAGLTAGSTDVVGESGAVIGLGVQNSTTVPTANPTSGVVVYSEAGVLKVRQVDGTVVTVANVPDTGAWTTWAPTYTGITIGNATVSARYKQIGKTVHVSFFMTVGSTTTFSTSYLAVSLPVASFVTTTNFPLGSGFAFDASAGTNSRMVLGAYLLSQAAYFVYGDAAIAARTLSNLVPWTWASGDQLGFTATYEAA